MTLPFALALAAAVGSAAAQAPAEDFDALARGAETARVAGRLDEAVELYRRAVSRRPDWEEGWWHLATALYERERWSEARDAFEAGTRLRPDGGPSWAMLGLCEFRLGRREAALEHLRHGLGLGLGGNQELLSATRYHAVLLLNRFGRFDVAVELLTALARSQPESPHLVEAAGLTWLRWPLLPSEVPPERRELVLQAGRAGLRFCARRVSEAGAQFAELVRRFPREPGVHYAHGVFLLQDAPDAAIEAFLQELELSPEHVPARLQLAFEGLKRGEPAGALRHAERAAALAPDDFAPRNALGRILLELGQVERAVRELEHGVRLAPDVPEMRFALARAYARAGRTRDAERERAVFVEMDHRRRERGEARPPEL